MWSPADDRAGVRSEDRCRVLGLEMILEITVKPVYNIIILNQAQGYSIALQDRFIIITRETQFTAIYQTVFKIRDFYPISKSDSIKFEALRNFCGSSQEIIKY